MIALHLEQQQSRLSDGDSGQTQSAPADPNFRQLVRISPSAQSQDVVDAFGRPDGQPSQSIAEPTASMPVSALQPSLGADVRRLTNSAIVDPNSGAKEYDFSESPDESLHFAQWLPPIFFARPPILPRSLTPLEQLPKGSSGGLGAGKRFPKSIGKEPEPCLYCKRPTTREPGPYRFHREHVVPRSRGGNNSEENYAPACESCNLEKSTRTPEEWYYWIEHGGV